MSLDPMGESESDSLEPTGREAEVETTSVQPTVSNTEKIEAAPVPPVKPPEGTKVGGSKPCLSGKRVLRVATSRIKPSPKHTRKTVDEKRLLELMNSLQAVSQQCPCIGYVSPDDPSVIIVVDGWRRLLAALRLQWETLEVLVLDQQPSDVELRLAQLALTQVREKLSAPELAGAIGELMKNGLNQQEVAEQLGFSETRVSSILCINRLLPELKPLAEKLEASVVPIIARLPLALQKQVMEFAVTPQEKTGRLPSRAEVEKRIKALKGSKTVRVKALGGKVDGRNFRLEVRDGDDHDKIVGFLESLIKSVKANKQHPFEKLPVLLGG